MPLKPGKKNISKNIAEFHTGETYAKTKKKFGKEVADKQAVAAGINAAKTKPKKK
jgi:hypothetical protein